MNISVLLQKSKLLITSLFVLASAAAVAVAATPAYVGAQSPQQQACESIHGPGSWDAGSNSCSDGEQQLNGVINRVVNLFSVIVGIAAVIMIIVGGFLYVTSGGDSSKLTNAKHTIVYALIGLVIAALAQIIVRFVLDQAV